MKKLLLKIKEMEILLYDLIKNWEDEVVEFKEASNDYDKDRMDVLFGIRKVSSIHIGF